MRITLVIGCILLNTIWVSGQDSQIEWYSETENKGVVIQNSFPKGGPYKGLSMGHYNPSYLVFFSRVINKTNQPLELDLHFSADPIAIPNSSDTYVKLFLPTDTMTLEKVDSFSYGIRSLASLHQSTRLNRKVGPGEEVLFYVVAFFYQTRAGAWRQERGGNRAALSLKGTDFFYNMPPQIDALPCGKITFTK